MLLSTAAGVRQDCSGRKPGPISMAYDVTNVLEMEHKTASIYKMQSLLIYQRNIKFQNKFAILADRTCTCQLVNLTKKGEIEH